MEQILNKFLVKQKTVSVTGKEHNSQSVPEKFLWRPKGSESKILMSVKVFFHLLQSAWNQTNSLRSQIKAFTDVQGSLASQMSSAYISRHFTIE